jgi:signal transduction histidine kinase
MKGRVSMDLHDLITPFYTSIKSRIDEADIKDPIKKQMEEDLSRVTGRIRRISHQMNIGFIEERTIKDLVQNLCMDLNFGSSVRIDCEIAGKEFHLSDEQKLHIYRIIQELMTNANKYVTSGEVSISISEEEGMFYIFYQDTGPGFTEDLQHKSGLGLMNIRERVKIIKGKAHLDSEPGTGTSWKIIIPLDQDNHKKTP